MTIGIVGSRRRTSYKDQLLVEEAFLRIYNVGDKIVSGGCPKGADRFAELIAARHGVPIRIHYPDKGKIDQELFKKSPRGAWAKVFYERNTLIAQDADALIACVAEDRTGGTEDTIRKFQRLHPNGYLVLV